MLFITFTDLGITGVSIATFISLTLFNVLKLYFNYKKFGVHPFTKQYISVLVLLFLSLIVGLLVPNFGDNHFVNLCLKPLAVVLVFFFGNQFFKIIAIKEVLPKSLFK